MKISKTEKIWLTLTVIFYLLYNLPGVPPYGMAIPTLVHAALTVLPLWIIAFVGMSKTYKVYQLKKDDKDEG